MSRTIKFRAWDIRRQIMVQNALELSETNQLVTVDADHFNSPFSFFDGCKWMQFTGQKDKNDKEIYEGDICRYDDSIGFIRFDWGWAIDFGNYSHDMPFYSEFSKRLEVIGNVYENRDLIKSFMNID